MTSDSPLNQSFENPEEVKFMYLIELECISLSVQIALLQKTLKENRRLGEFYSK